MATTVSNVFFGKINVSDASERLLCVIIGHILITASCDIANDSLRIEL